ncbi:20S proteasome subunit [Crepidotus variabilis]|uniref:Proteasome subunit alpha type n=1 Tax=Crepidotus variabilis TaxID=179855 RepID=A0A9P6ETW7_9AGAR|nr:20S proteasome subunit [Crepidotus variabilis]
MTSIGTGYDLSASTYSPDGRIFQIEYAGKAVENSGTVIGLKVKDGIVLAVENLIHSKLLVPEANRRIQTVDRHIGLATAGFLADGRQIANRARDECASQRDLFSRGPELKTIVNRLGLYVQAYTLYSSVRPFGISTILGTVDKNGPSLHVIEPSGVSFGYHGAAIGKGRQLAKTELEKLKLSELSMSEAVLEAARIIYLVHEDAKEKDFELEVSWIGPESNFTHVHVPNELYKEACTKAKAALETFD